MNLFAPRAPRLPLGSYGPFYFRRTLSLSPQQAATHMHVMGKSGSGKSRFLAHWYVSLLKAGQAATLVDPHGDTARLVLAHLLHAGYFQEPNAHERLWYLDIPTAARQKRYLPFNLLAQGLEPTTIASNFKEAMHRAFPELAHGAATFDTLLPRAIRVLLHHRLPVTQLEPFLLDKAFRSQLLTTFPDANVVLYFRQLEKLRESDHFNYIGSVLRRAQRLRQN